MLSIEQVEEGVYYRLFGNKFPPKAIDRLLKHNPYGISEDTYWFLKGITLLSVNTEAYKQGDVCFSMTLEYTSNHSYCDAYFFDEMTCPPDEAVRAKIKLCLSELEIVENWIEFKERAFRFKF